MYSKIIFLVSLYFLIPAMALSQLNRSQLESEIIELERKIQIEISNNNDQSLIRRYNIQLTDKKKALEKILASKGYSVDINGIDYVGKIQKQVYYEVGDLDKINVLNKRYGDELINFYFDAGNSYFIKMANDDYLLLTEKGFYELDFIFLKNQSIKDNDYSKLRSQLAKAIQGEITWYEDFHFANTNGDVTIIKEAIILKNWTVLDNDDPAVLNYFSKKKIEAENKRKAQNDAEIKRKAQLESENKGSDVAAGLSEAIFRAFNGKGTFFTGDKVRSKIFNNDSFYEATIVEVVGEKLKIKLTKTHINRGKIEKCQCTSNKDLTNKSIGDIFWIDSSCVEKIGK